MKKYIILQDGVEPDIDRFRQELFKASDMQPRIERVLAVFHCIHRGTDQLRIEPKRGSCSCSDAPVFSCAEFGECSLWKFSQTQSMACCQGCKARKQ